MTEPTSPYPDTENGSKMFAWDSDAQQWVLIGVAPLLPPLPEPNKAYTWDEATQSWVKVNV
jgi:hypothetical protein